MKILSIEQIRKLDQETISNKMLYSWQLMDQAAKAYFHWLMEKNKGRYNNLVIYVGPGNNGGDGLVIARLAFPYFNQVIVVAVNHGVKVSKDFAYQKERLPKKVAYHPIRRIEDLQKIKLPRALVIDAIFGSGLNRPPEGIYKNVITDINQSNSSIYSIDIPSGLYSDQITNHSIVIKAKRTGTLQLPKKSFFYTENTIYTGKWEIIPIGLDEKVIDKMATQIYFIDDQYASTILKERKPIHHKGNFGHTLLAVGSAGMAGAAILATKAAMRSGAGKTTTIVPDVCRDLLQATIPEAMIQVGHGRSVLIDFNLDIQGGALGIGCGIGKNIKTIRAFENLLSTKPKLPLVLDADALNIIADKKLLNLLPPYTIITPHPGEYERLFGKQENSEKRIENQIQNSQKYKILIVYKGVFTTLSTPDGTIFYNSSGNPGMATAGSGDVLTGIITSLVAQGYSSEEACLLGVYIHGYAGDLAAIDKGYIGLIASDIINFLPVAFNKLYKVRFK